MKKLLLTLFLMLFIFIGYNSYSQILLPGVSSPTIQKISVVIAPLENLGIKSPYADSFEQVLKNDLENAALFDVRYEPVSDSEGGSIDFQSLYEKGIDAVIAGQYKIVDNKLILSLRVFDVWWERPLDGKTYTASPLKIREAAHRFANVVIKSLTGIDGFFTSKVVFVKGDKKKKDLFIMDYDGFNVKKLTSHQANVMSPDCSQDGRKLIFNSDKDWDHDVYVLYLLPRKWEQKEQNISKAFILEQSAEWSPDGSHIAFSSKGDIYVSDKRGKGLKRLTRGYKIDVSPTWSPDGKSIAFVSDRSGSPQIYVVSAKGGKSRKITSSGNYNTSPSWSPNPRVNKIAYVSVKGLHSNVFTVNPDGSDVKQLTFGSKKNENPSWSPDGYFITYSSDSNVKGKDGIYIMYFTGENQKMLTKDNGRRFPVWCKR